MKHKRRNPKRDANEPEIIEALKAHGCLVMQQDDYDLLVQAPGNKLYMLEVKSDTGTLTDKQRGMMQQGWSLKIVRTPMEAIMVIEQ